MKILLVVPRYVRFQGEQYSFPLGLGYIAAALKGAGHTVRGLNLNHDYRPSSDVIAEAIADFDPDACGTGTLSPLYPQANQIFTAARAAKPDIINIAGGGMISSGPEIAARVLDFDFGVIGEGEESTVELADALNHGRDPRQVPGLVLRDRQGATTLTAPRDPIRAIDDLPWPDYEAFGIREWFALVRERAIQMIASRSCPLSCSFCFHPSGRTYRVRNLDRFFKEFDHLNRAYGVTTLSLNDELFALNTDRIRDFCTRIKPYGVQWNLALHVHSVDAETLEMMRDSGCSLISYGVESVNADVLKSMRKNATRADIERTLRMTHEKNIEVQGNLIFGDCAETIETVNDSLHWWGENRDLQINLIMLKVYPGSRIFEDAVADGRIADGVAQLIEPGRNFSKLDDASHAALLNRIMEFNETLLMPARVERFEREAETHPLHGTLYAIDWRCPRCGTLNEKRRFPINNPQHFQTIRMPCGHCRARFDIQNMARRPWVDEEAESLYRKAVELRDAGRIAEAGDIYKRILGMPFESPTYNRPDAVAKATYDLGLLILDHGSAPQTAVAPLTGAVLLRAFDPMCHFALGRAYLADNLPGAAKLHFQQVLRLLNIAEAAPPGVRRCGERHHRFDPGN